MAKRAHSPSTSGSGSAMSPTHSDHTKKRARSRPSPRSAPNPTSEAAASDTPPNACVSREDTPSVAAGSANGASVNRLLASIQDARDIDGKIRKLKEAIVGERHACDRLSQLQAKSEMSILRMEEAISYLEKHKQKSTSQAAQSLPCTTVQLSMSPTVQPPACPTTQIPPRQPERLPDLSDCDPYHVIERLLKIIPENQPERLPEHQLEHSPAAQKAIDNACRVAERFYRIEGSHHIYLDYSLEDTSDLSRSNSTYQVSCKRTKTPIRLDYTPRCALLHQFAGTNYKSVVPYGKQNMQVWNPANNTLVGVLNSGSEKSLDINHVKPVAASVLAMVSGGLDPTSREYLSGVLHFAKVKCPAQNGKFSMATSRPWIPDGESEGRLSVVEGVYPEGPSDDTQVTLFTGSLCNGTTGGKVYRRVFDTSARSVKRIHAQEMDTKHSGRVTALCHVEAKKYVVSGSVYGDIFCNDHILGTRTQGFSVGDRTLITSITGCPFSPDLFMVGTSQPKSRLLIYDNRDRLEVGKPKLILEAKNCIIPSMDCSPAWDADTGLIFAPMRRYASGEANGIVNVWDPRYVKPGRTAQLRIPHDKDDILSVDIARSAAGSDPMMVTASKNGIAFTDLNCESI